MNKDTLLNLIKNPANISNDEAEMLEEIVRQNPYFQIGHLLIAKFQHTQKSTLATQKIRKASLYSYSRSRLKNFLDVVNSTEDDNPQTFKTASKDAKVFFENIQNEISDFDKKFAEADSEIITKELEKAYQTDNYKLEVAPADVEKNSQTDNQKEQNDLIDAFLNKTDTPRQTEKNTDLEVEDITDNSKENPSNEVVDAFVETPLIIHTPVDEPVDEPAREENIVGNNTENTPNEVVDAFVETSVPTYEPAREEKIEENGSDSQEEVTEIQAITLYASGKNKEAIEVYKKLLKINPDKKDYYQSQIEILSDFSDDSRIETPSSDTRQEIGSTETRDLNNVSFDTTPAEIVMKEIVTETIPERISTEVFGDRKEVGKIEIPQIEIPKVKIPEKVVDKIEEKKTETISPQITEKHTSDDSNPQILHEDVALKLLDEGRMEEAVEVYKKLILQNPEKKAYFVTQIEILEN